MTTDHIRCLHSCSPTADWYTEHHEYPLLEHGRDSQSPEFWDQDHAIRQENLITGEIITNSMWGLKEAVWFATRKFPVREAGLKALRKQREKYRRNKRSHKPNP